MEYKCNTTKGRKKWGLGLFCYILLLQFFSHCLGYFTFAKMATLPVSRALSHIFIVAFLRAYPSKGLKAEVGT